MSAHNLASDNMATSDTRSKSLITWKGNHLNYRTWPEIESRPLRLAAQLGDWQLECQHEEDAFGKNGSLRRFQTKSRHFMVANWA